MKCSCCKMPKQSTVDIQHDHQCDGMQKIKHDIKPAVDVKRALRVDGSEWCLI